MQVTTNSAPDLDADVLQMLGHMLAQQRILQQALLHSPSSGERSVINLQRPDTSDLSVTRKHHQKVLEEMMEAMNID